MSKYALLWEYLSKSGEDKLSLSFSQIHDILGFDIDHSFLNYKKELADFGYTVGKISLKKQTVEFSRVS